MSAPVLDAPATAVPELVYRDAASGCRVLVSPPGAAWDRWQEYLAGAWRNYRRHGVESVLDLDDVRDGRSSSLFFTVLDDDGVVVGGMRSQGPYHHADESHAVTEWEGDAGQDTVRREVAARLRDGVVESKTGWVADDAPHRRELARCLARGPVHAAALLGARYALGTSAEHTLGMWSATGAVVVRDVAPVAYPDDRYRTSLIVWDRWRPSPHVAPAEDRALRAEHAQLLAAAGGRTRWLRSVG